MLTLTRICWLLTLAVALCGNSWSQVPDPSRHDPPFSHLIDALLGVNMPSPAINNCPPPLNPSLDCAYYAGDFVANPAKQPNGLLNGIFTNGTDVVDGQVWVPLKIKKQIAVQGVFVNQLFASVPPPQVTLKWAIRQGISPGNGGTVVSQCGGSGTANRTATGRTFVSGGTTYVEYNYLLLLAPADQCELWNPAPPSEPANTDQPSGGKGSCPPDCFVSAGPTSGASELAPANFGYLSDVPRPAPHHVGLVNDYDNSFYFSTFFHRNFVPTFTPSDSSGVCLTPRPNETITTGGCHLFSIGIVGTGN